MTRPPLHSWNLDPEGAIQQQLRLRELLSLTWDERSIEIIGGVDVSFPGNRARAGIVLMSFPALKPLTAIIAEAPLSFPYIPGLLSFREGPAILAAWEKLSLKPDLLLFDGQGIAHPRGMGIASQMGLWLELPTVGVAKSRLYGRHAPVGAQAGEWSELFDERHPRRVIGAVLRTREKTNPVYVSPGHLIDHEHALNFVMACCRGYRLPEPTRWAHKVCTGAQLPGGGELLAR